MRYFVWFGKDAQGVIEFIVLFGALLFFFVTFFSVIQVNIQEKNLEKERIIAQNVALDVQYEINLASDSSEGYSREFQIPQNILGKDYQINVSENRIYVSMENFGVSYKVSTINGSVQKGANVIRKENGTVFIN